MSNRGGNILANQKNNVVKSLQKSIKQALIEGVKFYRGKGTLK